MATGNYALNLGLNPIGQTGENPYHTTIQNLKKNLKECREELIACREELIPCRANNNNLKNQIKFLTGEGGRKRKKTMRKNKAKQKKQNSDRNRKFVNRYKKLLGCTLCGWNKSTWGLHFDHLNPHDKTKDISKMMSNGRGELKKEMRKCRLICANCHSIHTEQQHLSKKYGWHLGGKTQEITAPVQLQLEL